MMHRLQPLHLSTSMRNVFLPMVQSILAQLAGYRRSEAQTRTCCNFRNVYLDSLREKTAHVHFRYLDLLSDPIFFQRRGHDQADASAAIDEIGCQRLGA